MARGDIKINFGADARFVWDRTVASGTAVSIKAGEPTKSASQTNIAIMVDGDGTTSQVFTGIAKDNSTDTVAAAGRCNTYFPLPGIIYAAQPLLTTAANTAAKIDALLSKRVFFDLTAGSWTIDTAQADATTNGLLIYGGDYRTNTVYFMVKPNVTHLANPTT